MSRALLNSKQTARMLRCSQRHVQRLVVRGALPSVAIMRRGLRFRPESVQAMIARLEATPAEEKR